MVKKPEVLNTKDAHEHPTGKKLVALTKQLFAKIQAGYKPPFRLTRIFEGKIWFWAEAEYICVDPEAERISYWTQHRRKQIDMIRLDSLEGAITIIQSVLKDEKVEPPVIDPSDPMSLYNDTLTEDEEEWVAEIGCIAGEIALLLERKTVKEEELPENVFTRKIRLTTHIFIRQNGYWIAIDSFNEKMGRCLDPHKEGLKENDIEWGARPEDIPIAYQILSEFFKQKQMY